MKILLINAITIINGHRLARRMVNGVIQLHPKRFLVSIQRRNQHYCGGTLITPNLVLTASHCQSKPETDTVVINTSNSKNLSPDAERIPIKKFIQHELYDDDLFSHDIALIQLQHPVHLAIEEVELASEMDMNDQSFLKSDGFGRLKSQVKNIKGELYEIEEPVINTNYCKSIQTDVGEDHICVKRLNKLEGFCNGDSGGPLYHELSENKIKLYGVVNFSEHCGYVDEPDVYASVPHFYSWIMNHINKLNQNSLIKRDFVEMDLIKETSAMLNKFNYTISVDHKSNDLDHLFEQFEILAKYST